MGFFIKENKNWKAFKFLITPLYRKYTCIFVPQGLSQWDWSLHYRVMVRENTGNKLFPKKENAP